MTMAKEFLGNVFSWRSQQNANQQPASRPDGSSQQPVVESQVASVSRQQPPIRKDSFRQKFIFHRIGDILRSPSSASLPMLMDYNQSDFKQYWMPDSRGRVCYECQQRFTTFRRRHHCRICGQIFCNTCCHLAIPGHLLGCSGDLRVCTLCAKAVITYLNQSRDLPIAVKEKLLDTLREEEGFSPQTSTGDAAESSSAGAGEDRTPGALLSGGPSKQRKLSDWEDLTPLFQRQENAALAETPSWPTILERSNSVPPPSLRDGLTPVCPRTPSPVIVDGSSIFQNNDSDNDDEFEEPDWLKDLEPTFKRLSSDPASHASSDGIGSQEHTPSKAANRYPSLILPCASEVDGDGHPLSGSFHEASTAPPTPTISSVDGERSIALAFAAYQERAMNYLLRRARLGAEWKAVLFPLAQNVAHSLRPNTKDRKDSMDMRRFFHVKRVPCDTTGPGSRLIFGVAFTKAIADTRMRLKIANPKILLIAGGIEYERTNRFTSFEPILTQEESHIKALVAKIEAVSPDVLIVEQSVARIALSLLEREGITLLSNVKMSVMKRVARATGAEIVISVESLFAPPRLGTCGYFRARALPTCAKEMKHVVFFEDCPPHLACSVILTGPDPRDVKAAKGVLLQMTALVYSGILQQAWLALYAAFSADEASERPSFCSGCEAANQSVLSENLENEDERAHLNSVLSEACLHTSPFISTELPCLERPEFSESMARRYFKGNLYPFDHKVFGLESERPVMTVDLAEDRYLSPKASFAEPAESLESAFDEGIKVSNPIAPKMTESPTPDFTNVCITQPIGSTDVQRMMAEYRAWSALVLREEVEKENAYDAGSGRSRFTASLEEQSELDVLIPEDHQRLTVLFSSYSEKSPNAPGFCINPWVVSMDFYGRHDICLGDFLERYCFNPRYFCPSPSCDAPMQEHRRRFVHGSYCIQLMVERLPQDLALLSEEVKRGREIVTWSFCAACNTATPNRPVPDQVWQLSFATFLLYLFRGKDLLVGNCSHCLTHEHVIFFAGTIKVASFVISPIKVHDLTFTELSVTLENRSVDMTKTWLEFENMFAAGEQVFNEIERHIVYYEVKGYSGLEDQKEFLRNERQRWRDSVAAVKSASGFGAKELYSLSPEFQEISDFRVKCLKMTANFVLYWNSQVAHFAKKGKLEEKTGEQLQKKGESAKDLESLGNSTPTGEIPPNADLLKTPPAPLSPAVLPSVTHLTLPLTQPPVLVHEEELSSVVAYGLASPEYKEKMSSAREQFLNLGIAINLKLSPKENALAGTMSTAESGNDLQHIDLQFSDVSTNFYVKVYFAEHFRLFRKLVFPQGEEAFIRSLGSAKIWKPKGGKSGASFFKTRDDRLIIKQMSKFELRSFLEFAGRYLNYVTVACTEDKLSALAKIIGVFRVAFKNSATGTAAKMDLMVSENLFYSCGPLLQIYDLKGSKRNRLVDENDGHDVVLMDENFVRAKVQDPMYIYPHSKACLVLAIENDARFLSEAGVMDYSLLVGMTQSGQLVAGMIDFLRTYTFDKRVESWVKSVSGSLQPTVVSPEVYCARFAEAMDIYFPVAPDQWASLSTNVKYCAGEK